jgi:hypothetical protein
MPSTPFLEKAMSHANLPPMDLNEAYLALGDMIRAKEPAGQDDVLWSQILAAFSVASPDQRHINLLVEAAGCQLLWQLMDTLCRLFMLDPHVVHNLAPGLYQDYTAAIAALPLRMLNLRATRGVEFCESVRQTIEERWAARDVVSPWSDVLVIARREAELEEERRLSLEMAHLVFGEGHWEN